MAKDRKKVTALILKRIAAIVPEDKTNVETLGKLLNSMSDERFEDYIRRLGPADTPEKQKEWQLLPYYLPNLGEHRISIAHIFKLSEEMGTPLREKLIMVDSSTGNEYVTPHKYPVFLMPCRRQSQTLIKKRSVPEGEQRIDDLTGQPTNLSKGSRISSPEHGSLASRGLDKTAREFLHFRGGNDTAYREMRRLLVETGEVSQNQLEGLGSVKSTNTAAMLLDCMHLGNNMRPETKVPDDAKKRTS